MNNVIQIGTMLRFTASPTHYSTTEFVVGNIYEVVAICLHGENRVPAFLFKGKENVGWITERFFKELINYE